MTFSSWVARIQELREGKAAQAEPLTLGAQPGHCANCRRWTYEGWGWEGECSAGKQAHGWLALTESWGVGATCIAGILTGRKPSRHEAQDVANWNWGVEAPELPLLLAEAKRAAGEGWHGWLLDKRYAASGTAGKVRAIAARLPRLLEQELARALEPDTKQLEKITRYEAHLERGLYRALHELEAMQERRAGNAVPLPAWRCMATWQGVSEREG